MIWRRLWRISRPSPRASLAVLEVLPLPDRVDSVGTLWYKFFKGNQAHLKVEKGEGQHSFARDGGGSSMKSEDLSGRTIAHYRILKRLGEGGMGVVYKAEDTKLRRTIALKFIRPEVMHSSAENTRFRREARASAALNHPHITTIHDIGEADGRLFIAMEYLDGQTLREKLKSGPLGLPETLDLAEQLADGLRAAHERGVIHRDIKSGNVMVDKSGTAKITDFGLARLAEGSKLTRTAAVMGTASYMSPEQAEGEAVDHRTDIWSLGVVLYEMAGGRPPFRGENDQASLYAIINKDPVPVTELRPGLPLELERIIGKCLEKKPDKRYQQVGDLKADLGRLNRAVSNRTLTAEGTRLPGPGLGFFLRKYFRRALVPLGVLVLLALVVTGIPPLRSTVGRWLGLRSSAAAVHLAVLPFEVIGGEEKDRAFSDGLVEILTNKLTQVERFQGTLRVVPAIEARQLERPSPGKVWRMFRANRVITGSMQFIADEVVVTLNLVDSEKLRQLKSRDFKISRTSLAALPEAVADSITRILDLEIQPRTRQAWASREGCNQESSPLYIQAKGYLQRYEKEASVNIALDLFQRAIDKDPNCALAFAGLGEAFWYKYGLTFDKSFIDQAQQAAERALQLNKDLAEVHFILGVLHRRKGNYDLSLRELELASRLDPGDEGPVREMGTTYESLGKVDKAEQAYQQAIALKPNSWSGYQYLGIFYLWHGRYAEAEKNFREIIELTPDNQEGYNLLGALYLQTGRNAEAIGMFEKSIGFNPTPGACSNLGTAYFYEKRYAYAAAMYEKAITLGENQQEIWGNLGDAYRFVPGAEAKAQQAYRTAIRLTKEKLSLNPNEGGLHKTAARFYALVGDRENALAELERALSLLQNNTEALETAVQVYELVGQRDTAFDALRRLAALGSVELIELNPDLAGLRKDPRYRQIVGAKK